MYMHAMQFLVTRNLNFNSKLVVNLSISQLRMERQRREEEVKTRSSKKGQEAEQVMSKRVSHSS